MKKFVVFSSLLLLLGTFLAGCGNEKSSTSNQDTLTIFTTVYPLQYFAERIGGDSVTVETVYPPGADEHTFEPTQKDMMNLADSDLFIYVGLGLEGFVEKAKDTLKDEDVTMLAAGESIHLDESESEEEEHSHDDGHDHGDIDPHVWIDPLYSKEMAEKIKEAMIEEMPEKEEEFINNYNELAQQLDQLNSEFTETIGSAENKEIIVSHAAFGYWGKRYGLEQISISGLSTSNEPSQKDLEAIVSTAKEHNLEYIFFEQNVSSKLTETVQKEIGAKALTLHNLSVLTDSDIKEKRDYMSIMEDNLSALKKALEIQ